MRSLGSNRMIWGLALLLTFMVGAQARADLVIEYNSVVTGGTPSGAGPWLRATFTDVTAGTVKLKLENLVNSASEFISNVYFNINPALTDSGWSFAFQSGQNTASTPVVNIDTYN